MKKCAFDGCKEEGTQCMRGYVGSGPDVRVVESFICRSHAESVVKTVPVTSGFSLKPMEPVPC